MQEQPKTGAATADVGDRSRSVTTFSLSFLAVALLAARAPTAMRKLWAEDGAVFLEQARTNGPLRPFLQASAGYYQLVPRIIGAIAAAVPLRAAALTTWLVVAVVVGWCAGTVYADSTPWLTNLATRGLLALSVVLLPALGLESIASAASLQFTLLFASLIALLGASPRRAVSRNRVVLIVVTGLTTPLSLLLAPFVAMRVWRRPRKRPDGAVIGWAVSVATELALIGIVRPSRKIGAPKSGTGIVSGYVRHVLGENLLPHSAARSAIGPVLVMLVASGVATVAYQTWRRSRHDLALVLVVVPMLGFVFWIVAGLQFGHGLPSRYRLFPAWCTIWSVLAAADAAGTARRLRWRRTGWISITVAAALFGSWATYWTPAAVRTSGSNWTDALSTAAQRCRLDRRSTVLVRIAPVGPTTVWAVRVLCDDLR
jgi:hypothetical protein